MLIPTLQIIGGLLLLFGGGEILVRGAVALARSLGLPTIVIGLTIVAYGTSAPELVVSIQAAIKGYASIALGNVIGSNISNILLVLGGSALIYPIVCGENKRDSFVMTSAVLLLIFFCFDGNLSPLEGVIFLALLVSYTIWIFKSGKGTSEVKEEIPETHLKIWQSLLFIISGIAMLVFGSDFLVEGGVTIAKSMGVSEAVIGLTLVAVGSSAPELVTSIVAAFRKHSDVAIGNIVGSNIVNVLGILGITGTIMPVSVEQKFLDFDLWVMIGVTVLMVIAMNTGKKVSRLEGLVFFAGYIAYTAYQFYS